MKLKEATRVVSIRDESAHVTLGDTIWWFNQNQTKQVPHVAVLLRFGEDNMVDLAYYPLTGGRLVHAEGVSLIGSPQLANKYNQKKGSWCPRIGWKALALQE